MNPVFLESTIRYSDDLSDEDKKALLDMLHPNSGEAEKRKEEVAEERFNGSSSMEDWKNDLEFDFRGTSSLPAKSDLKKFEDAVAQIEDPEERQKYEAWLDRMKEHTHLFGKVDDIFFMEDPDLIDNLVDLIQDRNWNQLYQDIRGHNLNDEVDRNTKFIEALEDAGVDDKEIQYVMEVVGPILEGLEIKKSFRDIMRERNPDWE